MTTKPLLLTSTEEVAVRIAIRHRISSLKKAIESASCEQFKADCKRQITNLRDVLDKLYDVARPD